MIEKLKRINDLDTVLSKMDEEQLNNLYFRVFMNADGELILQDMANRFHQYSPTNSEFQEGQRSAYVSIVSRLRSSVAPKEEDKE